MNITNLSTTATTTLEALVAGIEAKASAKALDRRIAILSTESGANKLMRQKDGRTLGAITTRIADITEKPVFSGFTYNGNVETIVAIASALQYMKGDLRESISETIWATFDGDTRTDIINAYGRLPYLADELAIEINGVDVIVDPNARPLAKAGIQPNVAELEMLVNTIAMNLNLLGEYNCTQREADKSWADANRKINKAEILDSYKASL